MGARAAGEFRRTPLERANQRVSWERTDQAFFAAGACHLLAWACRAAHPQLPIGLAAIRLPGEAHVFHTYATWGLWAFDHAGWNLEADLIAANERFERRTCERVQIDVGLAEFCERHHHRTPEQYWQDPWPRAQPYVARHAPPWLPVEV